MAKGVLCQKRVVMSSIEDDNWQEGRNRLKYVYVTIYITVGYLDMKPREF